MNIIPEDEMYLKSPGWQRMLKESETDIENGNVVKSSSVEDLIKQLNSD
jgi:hypothetical protein